MAKETRASNSVLMGKLNYPLPKNFASKILPIENKIFSGPNALKKPAKVLALAYLPLVLAYGERCIGSKMSWSFMLALLRNARV